MLSDTLQQQETPKVSLQHLFHIQSFSPDKKYPQVFLRRGTLKHLKSSSLATQFRTYRHTYSVREESKVRELGIGDEFMGGKIVGVWRGFLMVRDYEGVKKLKISWERIREAQNPAESTNRGVQRPPRQLMELLQEGK